MPDGCHPAAAMHDPGMLVTTARRVLPLRAALATARGPVARREVWTLAIRDDAGLVGVGEASPLPGFGGEDPVACAAALAAIEEQAEPPALERWLARRRPDAALPLDERLAATPCARAAFEGALIDLMARRIGAPVSLVLAADAAERIPVSALVASDAALPGLAADGWRVVKLKAGSDPEATARRCRAAAAHGLRIRVDANGAWSPDHAAAFAAALGADASAIDCLEQPLPPGDLDGHAALRRRLRLRIALDESIRSAGDVLAAAERQACDAVVLKPAWLGGWRPLRQAAEAARSCGLAVIVTTALDGAVGRAHASHAAAALGLAGDAHGLNTGPLLAADLAERPLAPTGGSLVLPLDPGLGIGRLA